MVVEPAPALAPPVHELSVGVVDPPLAFALPAWAALAERVDHPFAGTEWICTWWRHFGAGREPLVLRVRRGAADTAIVPLCVARDGGTLELIGGCDLTDYLGPACDAADEAAVGRAVGRWLSEGHAGCGSVDLRFLRPETAFAAELCGTLAAAGAVVTAEPDEVVARLPLASSWDEQLARLASKDRHELRRKRRRFEAATGAAPIIRRSDARTLEADLSSFVALHRCSRGRKGSFMSDPMAEFFGDVAARFLSRRELALELLEVEGRAVAATFSFERPGVKSLYNMAFDPGAAALSPGIVLVSELVRGAIDAGWQTFDMLRGGEDYKRRLGARMDELVRVRASLPAARQSGRR